MDVIHHYTDIETLALILKNKTLRLNRLDRFDDKTEARALSAHNIGSFLFASCWTTSSEESIPQWSIYGRQMTGVRITLPRVLFPKKEISVPDKWRDFFAQDAYSPLPIHKIWNDDYFVIPTFLNDKELGQSIQYVDNLEDVDGQFIQLEIDEKTGKGSVKLDAKQLGTFKSKSWLFQDEFRFVLFVIPSLPIPLEGPAQAQFSERWSTHIFQKLYHGEAPNFDYIDLDIEQDILDSIQVTIGPMARSGSDIIVSSLLERYAPNGVLRPSRLTDELS